MNISILGCGWLGFPLAKKFIEMGYAVKGSTTRREKMLLLNEEGIVPYQIRLYTDGVEGDLTAFLADANILVINVPPGLRKDPQVDFEHKIRLLKDYTEKCPVEHVIFVSSTSVYEDREDFPVFTEEDEPNGKATNSIQLIAVEKMLMNADLFSTTIIRFGGLIGPGRHPVNFLAGRKNIKDPLAPVNLIHLEDCLEIIERVIEKEAWGETINAVYPHHPEKETYYSDKAELSGLEKLDFDFSRPSKGKTIGSVKIKKLLDHSFKQKI